MANLLLEDQNRGLFQYHFHASGIGDEIGAQVAAIKLHSLHSLQKGMPGFRILDGDNAILADRLHCSSYDFANFPVAVGRDGSHLGDGTLIHRLRQLAKCAAFDPLSVLVASANNRNHCLFDAAPQCHRVGARRHRLHTFAEDGLRKNRRRGGAVARHVARLGSDFLHKLGSDILHRILQLDLFGHGHPVFGNGRRAKLLFNYDVAALGTKRRLNGVRQRVYATQDRLTGLLTVQNLLCHTCNSPFLIQWLILGARTFKGVNTSQRHLLFLDDAKDFFLAHDEKLLAVEFDLGTGVFPEEHAVARLDI